MTVAGTTEPLLRVMALHALAYCERLFYLEEVEELRVADEAVFHGRRVHEELEEGELSRMTLEAPLCGIRGQVDALRKRNGELVPIEVKRGRAAPEKGGASAWRTDQVQVAAYALLLEETQSVKIHEGRVRYLGSNVTVRVPIDDGLRKDIHGLIARAQVLRKQVTRPPVTHNERLCARCSLAPVCLPEEDLRTRGEEHGVLRLYPEHADRLVLHVIEHGDHVGRSGDQLVVRPREGDKNREEQKYPARQVGAVVLHGNSQISTQALRLCREQEIAVQWVAPGGSVTAALAPGPSSAQRHLRQFRALEDPQTRMRLSRLLVAAKLDMQVQFLLRGSRGAERSQEMEAAINAVREAARKVDTAEDVDMLLGLEGSGAAAYFEGLAMLVRTDLDPRLHFVKRTRRPSTDRMSTLLNYGYGMLYRECISAILAVGLHTGFGFYHRPRSAAPPLALDLMELFRVPLVDMAIVGALNRQTFDADSDFEERGAQVWLSQEGRVKAIELIERRKQDEWKHAVVGYSLSYMRMIELEVRLLEKEWSEEGAFFARFRMR